MHQNVVGHGHGHTHGHEDRHGLDTDTGMNTNDVRTYTHRRSHTPKASRGMQAEDSPFRIQSPMTDAHTHSYAHICTQRISPKSLTAEILTIGGMLALISCISQDTKCPQTHTYIHTPSLACKISYQHIEKHLHAPPRTRESLDFNATHRYQSCLLPCVL